MTGHIARSISYTSTAFRHRYFAHTSGLTFKAHHENVSQCVALQAKLVSKLVSNARY